MNLTVGQEVYAARDIIQDADDYSPRGLLASRGTKLIVRSTDSKCWYAYVSHPEITDNSFGVKADEIVEMPF